MPLTREVLAFVAVVLAGVTAMRSMPDLMVDKDDTTNEVQSNAIPNMLSNSVNTLGDGSCMMEIRYTKHVPGKCTAVRPGLEACVAGSYIHPFHADCLFGR